MTAEVNKVSNKSLSDSARNQYSRTNENEPPFWKFIVLPGNGINVF